MRNTSRGFAGGTLENVYVRDKGVFVDMLHAEQKHSVDMLLDVFPLAWIPSSRGRSLHFWDFCGGM